MRDAEAKWRLIAARALALAQAGRPVLIGTRSVAASERASALLGAGAGPRAAERGAGCGGGGGGGAGRCAGPRDGGDQHGGARHRYPAGAGVAGRGGLAVIATERHDAARIDRQLAGRCARQGEPGSLHVILSLEDALLDPLRLHPAGRLLLRLAARHGGLARGLFGMAQKREERRHRAVRRQLMRFEARMERAMAFAGRPD